MNWTVWTDRNGDLRIDPPLTDVLGEKEDLLLYTAGSEDDIRPVRNKMEALKALYDAYQTFDEMKEGDTFTVKGESTPFAYAESFHVLPARRGLSGERM